MKLHYAWLAFFSAQNPFSWKAGHLMQKICKIAVIFSNIHALHIIGPGWGKCDLHSGQHYIEVDTIAQFWGRFVVTSSILHAPPTLPCPS